MENVEPGRLGGDLKKVGNRQQQQQAARSKMLSGSAASASNKGVKPFRRFHSLWCCASSTSSGAS